METTKKNNRKLLLALPVLILPFLALAFYALGGGKGGAQQPDPQRGINTELPDAAFKKQEPQDKLSLYEQMGKDTGSDAKESPFGEDQQSLVLPSLYPQTDPDQQRINERLAQISRELNRPEPAVPIYQPQAGINPGIGSDVDRLEKLMRSMQEQKTEDPEMEQLSGMLDKIIRIQNPESIAVKSAKPSSTDADTKFRAIPAQIVSRQKAVQGATIKLRLQDTVTLNGYLIPKGHEIFGACRITNQRLLLDIKNIRIGTSIIPVDLTVYSLDGMPGIYAPEAMLADAAGSGADDAVRSIGMYGIDQTIATQVAGAGLDAAKSLFSKKVKRIKVKLEAGQPILLRNNQLKTR